MNTKSNLDLTKLGISQNTNIYRNLPVESLIEETILNGEGVMGMKGAVMVDTGIYTGRSPKDKYFVEEDMSKDNLWWGEVNQKIDASIFDELFDEKLVENEAPDRIQHWLFTIGTPTVVLHIEKHQNFGGFSK